MPQSQFMSAHFPKAGLDRAVAYGKQPARRLPSGKYARTAAIAKNVRAWEPATGRCRGGSRPGLSKFVSAAVVADWLIQHLTTTTGVGYSAPGGGVAQSSLSGRLVTLVAVSQGNVYVADVGDTAWTTPTNNTGSTPPLNITGIVRSAANNQKLYFADGVNARYYSPATNTVENWTATAGTFPVDSAGNLPRLIAPWRDRIIQSGLIEDPQNIFATKSGDATNFDYAPLSPSAKDAWALNLGSLGTIGDVANCLIPFSDDVLVVGGDSSIHVVRGAPTAGGEVYTVSRAIGMAFGEPYAIAPDGAVYFFSNRPGIYRMEPNSVPVRISAPIDELLRTVDTGTNAIILFWDDAEKTLEVFISPLSAPAAATHYTWEQRTGGWVQRTFGDNDFNPLCGCIVDGNEADDRALVIGSWDGYVRRIDRDATDDDGTDISSEVWIGPLVTPNFDKVMLHDLQAVLGETSGNVTLEVYVADTAEGALSATTVRSVTLSAGRNLTRHIRRSGHAIYVRLTSTSRWAMEAIRLRVSELGKLQMRGH